MEVITLAFLFHLGDDFHKKRSVESDLYIKLEESVLQLTTEMTYFLRTNVILLPRGRDNSNK